MLSLDELFVASKSSEEHVQHFRSLFTGLNHYGLTINSSKCTFGVLTIEFLGFKISAEDISAIPERVCALKNFPRLTTLIQLRRFWGI